MGGSRWGWLDMLEDHHAVLGVAADASKDEILHAYTELAKHFHPDYNPDDPHAGKRFIRIQRAFETLYEAERHPAIGIFHTPVSAFLNVWCRRDAVRRDVVSSGSFAWPVITMAAVPCLIVLLGALLASPPRAERAVSASNGMSSQTAPSLPATGWDSAWNGMSTETEGSDILGGLCCFGVFFAILITVIAIWLRTPR